MSWKRFKFGNQKLYVIPGTTHRFRTEHDAKFYCDEHGIDFATVEKYDSNKEYDRWLELQVLQRAGEISELRRQVEFELIPAKYETVHIKDKVVKNWFVPVHWDGFDKPFVCSTRKEAEAYCRKYGLPLKTIFSKEHTEPVYKYVCIEQNAVYTADFVYRDKEGNEVVEDVKSEVTRKEADYVLRRKLMLHVLGIRILET